MRKSGGLLAMAMMFAAVSAPRGFHTTEGSGSLPAIGGESEYRDRRRRDAVKKSIDGDRGIQEFTIDGITVRARNMKNAIRKVNNIKRADLNG